jgi:hypothetical protein
MCCDAQSAPSSLVCLACNGDGTCACLRIARPTIVPATFPLSFATTQLMLSMQTPLSRVQSRRSQRMCTSSRWRSRCSPILCAPDLAACCLLACHRHSSRTLLGSCAAASVRVVRSQNDGQKYIALINTVEDEAAKLSSEYSFAQLQFFNHVVRLRDPMHTPGQLYSSWHLTVTCLPNVGSGCAAMSATQRCIHSLTLWYACS